MYKQLKEKIENKNAVVAILGLGYVGLPLALEFAKAGIKVIGFDPDEKRIENLYNSVKYITDIDPQQSDRQIKRGKFVPTSEAAELKKADVHIICVPTPLRHVKTPDMSYIISAARTIRTNARKGSLVVLESTTYPGTSREVILPEMEKAGFCVDKDLFLCFSPERVDPGNAKFPIRKIPKVVGGISEKSTKLGVCLYGLAMDKVVPVSSIEAAETVKLLENTFRMINIGLINEFAILCNKFGIDVWEVIEGARTKPFGFMPFYPGPGLGGHCIPCDPVYLSWKAKKIGFKTKMIDLAASTNRYMPVYVVDKIREIAGGIKDKKIMLIGVTYKKDVKDLRESPALDIIDILNREKAQVSYHDPFIPYIAVDGIDMNSVKLSGPAISKADCVVIVTDHTDLNYGLIQKNAGIIYDTRNVYKKKYSNVVRL